MTVGQAVQRLHQAFFRETGNHRAHAGIRREGPVAAGKNLGKAKDITLGIGLQNRLVRNIDNQHRSAVNQVEMAGRAAGLENHLIGKQADPLPLPRRVWAGPVLNRCYLSRRPDAITAVAALARQTDSGQVILFSRSLAIRNSDRWISTVVVSATASIS